MRLGRLRGVGSAEMRGVMRVAWLAAFSVGRSWRIRVSAEIWVGVRSVGGIVVDLRVEGDGY